MKKKTMTAIPNRLENLSVHDLLETLSRDAIIQVYSGRPGCGCGCRGKYSKTKTAITRILNVLRANADKVRFHVFSGERGDEGCFALETDSRYRWLYVDTSKMVFNKESERKIL